MSRSSASTLPEVLFGSVCVDLGRMIVENSGKITDLSRREVLILQTLLDAEEATVSAQDIYRAAWETRGVPEGRALTFAMRRLRSKIESDVKKPEYVLTVRGVGFRLVGAVRRNRVQPAVDIEPDDLSQRIPKEPFFGRADELGQIQRFLIEKLPLLTVSGAGGVGKSRLVLEAMSYQKDIASIFLDLVDCGSKMDFLRLFSQRLGMVQQASVDWDSGILRIVSTLKDASFSVLILDNADRCLDAVRELMEWSAQESVSTQFIVTSREVIRLAEEQVVRLGALSILEARALFVERAYRGTELPQWNAKQNEALDEISVELAGCPLAIELAARRVSGLSLLGIRNRLGKQLTMLRRTQRDVHPRQLTLRATLQWSWELLPPEEQELLVACAVFCGDFDEATISSVIGATSSEMTLCRIENLVDKSMVMVDSSADEIRFSVPNGLREFVLSLGDLEGPTQPVVQRYQREHLRTFADAEPVVLANQHHMLTTMEQLHWVRSNFENILSAYRYGVSVCDVKASWTLARVAVMLMRRSQSTPSAIDLIREIMPSTTDNASIRAWAMIEMTQIYLSMGHLDRALQAFSVTDHEIEALADDIWCQKLRMTQAALLRQRGLFEEAEEQYRKVEAQGFIDVGIRAIWEKAFFQLNFGRREWTLARQNLDTLLKTYRELGAELQEPRVMNNYTHLAGVQGHLSKAYRRAKEALRLAELYEDKQVESNGLETLALITLKRGEIDEAKEYFEAAFAHRLSRGVADYNVNLHINYANVLCLHEQYEDAIQQSRTALSLAQQAKQVSSEVASMVNLGCLLMDNGEAAEAEFLFRRGIDLSKNLTRSLHGSILPLVLAISLMYQDRKTEAESLWAAHWDAAGALLTVDQVARLWFSRALAELHLDNHELARQYLDRGTQCIQGISEREIFECVWYRERIQKQLDLGR